MQVTSCNDQVNLGGRLIIDIGLLYVHSHVNYIHVGSNALSSVYFPCRLSTLPYYLGTQEQRESEARTLRPQCRRHDLGRASLPVRDARGRSTKKKASPRRRWGGGGEGVRMGACEFALQR